MNSETVEIDTTVLDSVCLSNLGLIHVGNAAVELVGEPNDVGTLPERVRVTGALTVEPHQEDAEDKWPVAPGTVLYEDRPDTPDDERRLHHVVARRIDPDTGERYVVIEDGTHTTRMHYHIEDVLADFAPAGWQWPTGRKPTYHLTRECGVYDRQDLMLEANR